MREAGWTSGERRAPTDADGSAQSGGRTTPVILAREAPLRLANLTIEPPLRRLVRDDGREEIIEPRVMQVLVALARSPGAILSRDDLSASCWHGVVVGEDAITRVIGRLRRLADGIGDGRFKLETITKVGYRLVPLNPPEETGPVATAPARSQAGRVAATPSPDGPGEIALHGERRYIYAMITDLQGFRELALGMQPEVVANVLNAYLDRLSGAVLEHGGTVDQFVGDAMVAFWGAPVARPDDGERAARAAMAIWRIDKEHRAAPNDDTPLLGRTRIGLHRGDAVVGAFGGGGQTSYRALGDAVNTAGGLESANKPLKTTILASRQAIVPSMADLFRAMGRIGLRGRSAPVEVFEAEPDFPSEARERWNAAYRRFDAGELAALGEMSALAADFPDDLALHAMLGRLEAVGPGGAWRLS